MSIFNFIINLFTKLFGKKETAGSVTPPIVMKPKPELTLPHPEEPENVGAKIEDVDVKALLKMWLVRWQVPLEFWQQWEKIKIEVTNQLVNGDKAAAEMDSTKNILRIRPCYCNPGTVAHEMAHESWSLLNEADKMKFYVTYTEQSQTPLVKLLHSIKLYSMQPLIEAHAEIYRYIGQMMPDSLKKYYPALF